MQFTSSEQALQYNKALKFHDDESARIILSTDKPAEQKQLGRSIVNFDSTEWSNTRDELFQDILRAKFGQNVISKNYILSTGNKILAEASLRDTYYGTGYSINHKDTLSGSWPGDNKLGSMLMAIRDELN